MTPLFIDDLLFAELELLGKPVTAPDRKRKLAAYSSRGSFRPNPDTCLY